MKRLAARLLALLLLLFALPSLLWLYAERRLVAGFDAWEAQARRDGWSVSHGTPARGGFPLEARLVVPDLAVAGRATLAPAGFEWRAERASLVLSPFHPTGLLLYPEGAQHIGLAGWPGVDLRAASMSVRLSATGQVADLVAEGLAVERVEGQRWSGMRAGAVRLSLFLDPAAKAEATALGLRFNLADLALPREERFPLGDTIAHLAGAVSLDGPLPAAPDPAAWRDAGGRAFLRELTLRWGLLGVTAEGDFSLDARLRPQGQASIAVTGQNAALDELADGGAIPARSAVAAKAVLGLIAHGDAGGPVTLPVVLGDGTLSIAGFPLVRLPAMPWQGG